MAGFLGMMISIIITLIDLVVIGTGHHSADGKVALGGKTHAEGKVAIGAQTVADIRAKTQADDGAHHPGVVELIAQIGVERHQGAVVVEVDTQADTGIDMSIEIEAVCG